MKPPPPVSRLSCSALLYLIRDVLWICILIVPCLIEALILKIIPRNKKDLKGKVVLITGAGNGLGKELACQLSRRGSTVLCVDIDDKGNEETLRAIKAHNGDGKMYHCDVSIPEKTKILANQIWDEFGKIDILINNAGVLLRNGVLTTTDEEIARAMEINFLSYIWMIRAFLPDMINRKEGHIVCISSASAVHSLAHGNIYSSSKFAILGMMYSLFEEFRSNAKYRDIKLSCALPYFIDSNEKYKNYWKIRLPALTKEKAAKSIIEGIQREYRIYTIPGMEFGNYITTVLRLLPNRLYHTIRDLFYADFILPQVSDNFHTKL